ncbi:MAG: hypothetical protein Q7K03_06475 [Dehalococcoidia bacterium]|nr:hypothetical protein [Dehalococcoidia bacterium]
MVELSPSSACRLESVCKQRYGLLIARFGKNNYTSLLFATFGSNETILPGKKEVKTTDDIFEGPLISIFVSSFGILTLYGTSKQDSPSSANNPTESDLDGLALLDRQLVPWMFKFLGSAAV